MVLLLADMLSELAQRLAQCKIEKCIRDENPKFLSAPAHTSACLTTQPLRHLLTTGSSNNGANKLEAGSGRLCHRC